MNSSDLALPPISYIFAIAEESKNDMCNAYNFYKFILEQENRNISHNMNNNLYKPYIVRKNKKKNKKDNSNKYNSIASNTYYEHNMENRDIQQIVSLINKIAGNINVGEKTNMFANADINTLMNYFIKPVNIATVNTFNIITDANINDTANESINKSINKNDNKTINEFMNKNENESMNKDDNETINESVNKDDNKTINEFVNKDDNETINESVDNNDTESNIVNSTNKKYFHLCDKTNVSVSIQNIISFLESKGKYFFGTPPLLKIKPKNMYNEYDGTMLSNMETDELIALFNTECVKGDRQGYILGILSTNKLPKEIVETQIIHNIFKIKAKLLEILLKYINYDVNVMNGLLKKIFIKGSHSNRNIDKIVILLDNGANINILNNIIANDNTIYFINALIQEINMMNTINSINSTHKNNEIKRKRKST